MKLIAKLNQAVNDGAAVDFTTCMEILLTSAAEITTLFDAATKMRQHFFANNIQSCSIMNAKSGACPENCAFCAQSIHHNTDVDVYALKAVDEILNAFKRAKELPISKFGIVASGTAVNEKELSEICFTVKNNPDQKVKWCASLGALSTTQLRMLKQAGASRYHHNIETAESFFSNICSSHSYQDRINTIKAAKECGLEVCVGGILGMGETLEQRVEMALALQQMKVDSIPLNFLISIAHTKLVKQQPLKPLDMLRAITMFRMSNPKAEIKIAAGRYHLRDLQALVFYAGATGIMLGDFLTTAGRKVEHDIQMLQDLEF
jgi:biotin synthase